MRIRTLKPEFWKSPKLAQLSWGGRLLFAGLICLSDDEGRFLANPRYIASELFPHDRSPLGPVTKSLPELSRLGLVVLYECSGIAYGFLPGFLEHQRVEKPTPSKLPPPPIPGGLREDSPTPPRPLPDSSPQEGKGREGKGTGKGREPTSPGDGFWLRVQAYRRERRHVGEAEPDVRGLSTWFSIAMLEVNGDEERLFRGFVNFEADPYWRGRGALFADFQRNHWRKYASEHYGKRSAADDAERGTGPIVATERVL